MTLTRRQQTVLSKFLDLYRQNEEPLHYTAVAEHLEVSPVTAYDMLRLLEERGLLASDYVPPSQREGGGRARVVFRPTAAAQRLLDELAGEEFHQEEWDLVKKRILQALHEGRGSDYQDLLDDLLVRIAEQRSPLSYAAEMITAIILQAYQLREEVADSTFFERLQDLGLSSELSLNAFGGLVVGLSFVERANRRITNVLLAQTSRYQQMLNRLNVRNRRRLIDFVGQVVEIVES